ncbi:MAG: TetR/AcrR family transcriptional regulator C-terminal domain-containing protein [Bacillota bacterium]|nr:TetR/AcrR family transcriptional regulator C-terminal domain-containing protein [Bacillota bacterium]
MKHEIQSLNTKKALVSALRESMKHKPLSKVTVSEIIAACNVNRKTFYYHFKDIYDLFQWMLEDEAVEVVKQFDIMTDYEEALQFTLHYVENNAHILRCAYDSLGRDGLKQFFYSDFSGIIRTIVCGVEKETDCILDDGFRDFICKFYTEAIAGMLCDLIRDESEGAKDNIIEYLTFLFRETLPDMIKKRGAFSNDGIDKGALRPEGDDRAGQARS